VAVDVHERAQFDFLLNTAAERFAERVIQRTGGYEALAALRKAPQGDGVWLDEFVSAILRDFLLDNVAGYCFVLQACETRRLDGMAGLSLEGASVTDALAVLALRAFSGVLAVKVDQGIEMALSGHME
jgi:hypothetical protein